MAKTTKKAGRKAGSKKSTARKTSAKKKAARAKTTAKAKSSSEIPVKAESAAGGTTGGVLAPLEDIEKLFGDFLQHRWLPFRRDWPRSDEFSGLLEHKAPSVDIVDRKRDVVVRAEIPGIQKDDLDVSIVDRTLTIKGSSRKEETDEGDDYFRHEIRSGTFSRSVLLPADVNAAKANATFKDGVLELNLPKVRASKRHSISLT